MAKLTLSFKDRIMKVFTLPQGDCLAGRDPDCDIHIDSLAVQPRHARFYFSDAEYLVEPVQSDCPLSIDGRPVVAATALSEGDTLQIGKHALRFAAGETAPFDDAQPAKLLSAASLQIQNGAHLGRSIRLNKALTRVGKPQGELAVIARRDDGYYLSALHGEKGPQLNDQAIGEQSRQLRDADRITIGELQLQFFSAAHAADTRDTPALPVAHEQRQFVRIPFEVNVTLQDEQTRWETRLRDVSLHGALIDAPQAFPPDEDKPYKLAVHLDGGPDICMEVETAHHQDGQVGLRCVHIDVDSITHLRRLVELNLGDPALLERELSALG